MARSPCQRICIGVRLDWIRRALQSKANRDSSYLNYSYDALLETALGAGCAVSVGFNEAGKSGHAIAIWRRRENKFQNDSYYLFDPNLGAFSYKEAELKKALRYMFWRDARDTPYYVKSTSLTAQQMAYMVFRPPNVV